MAYVKMTGTTSPHTSGATEVILERDEETGEPTKSVRVGEPVDLSEEEQEKLEGMGFVFEESSEQEAQEYQEQQVAAPQVGSDIAGAAPSFGTEEAPNQDADEQVDQQDST